MMYVKKLQRNDYVEPKRLLSKDAPYQPIDLVADDENEFFGEVVGRTGHL